jgi:glyoxylase-like metal-dependent hydrolase (beta-lactamase superfamily II)
VHDTPGHTPGGISFQLEDEVLVVGDTLFASSIGRTDLPGGNHSQLIASIQEFRKLPGSLWVLPGHGPTTSLEREFRFNPFLQ